MSVEAARPLLRTGLPGMGDASATGYNVANEPIVRQNSATRAWLLEAVPGPDCKHIHTALAFHATSIFCVQRVTYSGPNYVCLCDLDSRGRKVSTNSWESVKAIGVGRVHYNPSHSRAV